MANDKMTDYQRGCVDGFEKGSTETVDVTMDVLEDLMKESWNVFELEAYKKFATKLRDRFQSIGEKARSESG